MKSKFALKAGFAALALAAAGVANAGLFYLDIGTSYGPAADQVNSTSTSMKSEFQYAYKSTTFIADTNGDTVISAGDLLSTSAGLAVAGMSILNFGSNGITNFNPQQVGTIGNSNNGYGPNYQIGFSATGLQGMVTGVTGAGVPTFGYAPGGLIQLYLTTDFVNMTNFMNIKITNGGATGVSTILNGEVDFTGVAAAATLGNLFHSGTYTCAGSSGFYDIWNNCGGSTDLLDISFASSQDTNVVVSQFKPAPGGFALTSDHVGRGNFVIPEPGSLALLGLGLAGLGLMKRRRNVAM